MAALGDNEHAIRMISLVDQAYNLIGDKNRMADARALPISDRHGTPELLSTSCDRRTSLQHAQQWIFSWTSRRQHA